jgi:hypothetical protein
MARVRRNTVSVPSVPRYQTAEFKPRDDVRKDEIPPKHTGSGWAK